MKLTITLIVLTLACPAFAQTNTANPDSLAYQLQRKKINRMLSARAAKFGQYDASLSKHTGIFGLQTKKDIRRSNEILMNIIGTDNLILQETKTLLSLKDNQLKFRAYQQQTVQTKVKESEDVTIGYMNTINKLRTQNDILKTQAENAQQHLQSFKRWAVPALVVSIGLILFLLRLARRIKT